MNDEHTLWLRLNSTRRAAAAGGRKSMRSSTKQSGASSPLPVLLRTDSCSSISSPYLEREFRRAVFKIAKSYVQRRKVEVGRRFVEFGICHT